MNRNAGFRRDDKIIFADVNLVRAILNRLLPLEIIYAGIVGSRFETKSKENISVLAFGKELLSYLRNYHAMLENMKWIENKYESKYYMKR